MNFLIFFLEMDNRPVLRYFTQDRGYLQLCENGDWSISLGGDSHCRNICRAMVDMIGYQRYQGGVRLARNFNFAEGGKRAMGFHGDPLFYDLRRGSAQIVLLHLGGNDLDMATNRPWEAVVHDLLSLFVDLERRGKIVYIVGLPSRHSTRHQDLRLMQQKISRINKKLKRTIRTRFIALPPSCFPITSYERRWYRPRGQPNGRHREERVHLFPENYREAADHILFRLNMDLRGRLSPPRRIRGKVNWFLDHY